MSTFRADIETAINRNSAENGSDTPDYILARYLEACLAAFDLAVRDRDEWHGFTGATNPYAVPSRADGSECATCSGRGVWMDEPCHDCGERAQ